MSLFLKQSTSVVVSFGPFLDRTDGVTLEVGLVSAIDHATTGIFLSKNGGALTIRSQAVTASTYDAYGNYRVTLSTTDTNTLGTLRAQFSEAATTLPVWQDFMVVPANVWDSLFGADLLQVDLTQIVGVAQSATDLKDFADDGYDPATNKVQGVVLVDTLTTYTGNTPQTGDAFLRIGAAGASLTAVPWNAAWDAEVESEANDALVVHRLDELLNADSDIDGGAPPTVGSVFHELLTKTAGSFTYDQTTDSLEAVRDRGDAAWITATGFATPTNITAGTITTATNLTTNNDKTGYSVGVGGIVATSFGAGAIDAAAIAASAIGSSEIATGAIDADALAADVVNDIFMGTALTEAYAADGAAATPAQLLYMIWSRLTEFAISGTTLTAKKLDGATTAATFTLDDGTNPTSITRAT